MELTSRGPLLSVYEIRRVAAVGLVSDEIHVAQLGADEVRWVADLKYMQETPKGLVNAPVTVDLYAIGLDDSFTKDRSMAARIASRDPDNPFFAQFRVEETDEGIAYLLAESRIDEASRTFHTGVRVDYRFSERLEIPQSITPQGLAFIRDLYTVALNQTMIAGILRLARVPVIEPKK